VGKIQIFTRIYLRILQVGKSAFTPAPTDVRIRLRFANNGSVVSAEIGRWRKHQSITQGS